MSELYLFGSRARGDHQPDSDIDVFIDIVNLTSGRIRMITHLLRPYSVEYGGKLDLFELHGDDMLAVFDNYDSRKIIFDKMSFSALQEDAQPITLVELVQLIRGA